MIDDRTDRELIARACEGDAVAFRRIVDRYESVVAGVALGMLGPGAEAEDVGQEAFIRLYKSLRQFRGDASLKTYLTKIAMNLALTQLKRRKRARERSTTLSEADLDRKTESVEDPAYIAERRRLVEEALGTLDAKHRAVVVLRMMEGHSTKETARALGVPEGTVLSRLARALKKLQPHLEVLRES